MIEINMTEVNASFHKYRFQYNTISKYAENVESLLKSENVKVQLHRKGIFQIDDLIAYQCYGYIINTRKYAKIVDGNLGIIFSFFLDDENKVDFFIDNQEIISIFHVGKLVQIANELTGDNLVKLPLIAINHILSRI